MAGWIVFFMAEEEPKFDRYFSDYDEAEEHVMNLALEWEMQGRHAEWLIVKGSRISV